MITQATDSLELAPEEPQHHIAKPQHPYQVLRLLPSDATPAQQDSAIQAVLEPKEIHYSAQPDTLHLPGSKPGKNMKDVSIPKYYKEGFFSNDTLFHPELNGGRYGVAGDPIPYTMRNDNLVTGLLIACFILALIAFSHSKRFLILQIKNFFYSTNDSSQDVSMTTREVRFLLFFICQTCLIMAVLFFIFTQSNIADTYILSSPYELHAIFVGIFAFYFLIKSIMYNFVNWVFFDKKKTIQWTRTSMFIITMEGILLYPLALLLVFFNLSIESTVVYFIIVVILAKLLLFYKCRTIFFKRLGDFLQIILYFCALEIMPLLALWGTLVFVDDYLKINY